MAFGVHDSTYKCHLCYDDSVRDASNSQAPARCAIEELVDTLQVLTLSIDAADRDPSNRWHSANIPHLARRVLESAAKIAALLADERSPRTRVD